jgi:hypothetical protein
VLRHADNRKWYAVVMDVTGRQLGIGNDDRTVAVIDVKCDPMEGGFLRQRPGFLPAYHMNRTNWLTVLLDKNRAGQAGSGSAGQKLSADRNEETQSAGKERENIILTDFDLRYIVDTSVETDMR